MVFGSGNAGGGKGGYSVGVLSLTNSTTVYVCIGGSGNCGYTNINQIGSKTSYNGGGIGTSNSTCWTSGGGATHIATSSGILKNLNSNKESILLVAGGGGGDGSGGPSELGGYGGGSTGGTGGRNSSGTWGIGTGASISSGGTTNNSYGGTNYNGGFGYGGYVSNGNHAGGGGSGYYGGGASGPHNGNGGGSGYVNTSKLTSAQTIAGNTPFPNISGTGNETGHSGDGAAKITPVN